MPDRLLPGIGRPTFFRIPAAFFRILYIAAFSALSVRVFPL
jgi:hypothetical protein